MVNYENRIAKRAGIKVATEPQDPIYISRPKNKKSFTFHKLQNLHYNVDYKRRVYDVESLLTEYDTSTAQGLQR